MMRVSKPIRSLIWSAIDWALPAPSATMMIELSRPSRKRRLQGRADLVDIEGDFRDQCVLGAGGDCRGQRQVAAVAPHGFDHEGPVVGRSGVLEAVYGVEDVVQCGIDPQRHVGEGDVVVDRGGDGNDRDAVLLQNQRAAMRAVAADHHQPLDAELFQIPGGQLLTGFRKHLLAAGALQKGAAELQLAADRSGGQHLIIAVKHPLVAFLDADHLDAVGQPRTHHGADGGVHPRAVAAAGEHCNSFHAPSLSCP